MAYRRYYPRWDTQSGYKKYNVRKNYISPDRDFNIVLRNLYITREINKENYKLYQAVIYLYSGNNTRLPSGFYPEIRVSYKKGWLWLISGKLLNLSIDIADIEKLYNVLKTTALAYGGLEDREVEPRVSIELDLLKNKLKELFNIDYNVFSRLINKLKDKNYITLERRKINNETKYFIYFEK